MQLRIVPVGPLQCNCYVLWEDPRHAVVIDPGDEAERLIGLFKEWGVKPALILNTHGHFDHTGAVTPLQKEFKAPYRIHPFDHSTLRMLPAGSRLWGLTVPPAPLPDLGLEHGQVMEAGGLTVHAVHTPGHTPGSTCFFVPAQKRVFTGDTLFQGSIGRSDLPGGDSVQLLRSIHERLLTLPPDTVVHPGHGPQSTLLEEAENNPFLV